MSENKRIITQDILDHLDPLEQIIARQFIFEGRWILNNSCQRANVD